MSCRRRRRLVGPFSEQMKEGRGQREGGKEGGLTVCEMAAVSTHIWVPLHLNQSPRYHGNASCKKLRGLNGRGQWVRGVNRVRNVKNCHCIPNAGWLRPSKACVVHRALVCQDEKLWGAAGAGGGSGRPPLIRKDLITEETAQDQPLLLLYSSPLLDCRGCVCVCFPSLSSFHLTASLPALLALIKSTSIRNFLCLTRQGSESVGHWASQ